jgi:hypothetical protein
MNKVTIVVTFLQGGKTTIDGKSFTEALQIVFSEPLENLVPLKIEFPKTGKILYADKNVFEALLRNEITTEHAVHYTQCDALVRNIAEVDFNGFIIDPDSLWRKLGKECMLVDDDHTITHPWDESKFQIL